jgi:sulfatase maturation enzyme AslB (radical SAM superfamily)
MANQQIFCNTPWYEAHIYWDGSLGICCQESRKLYSDDQKYNIKNMTLREWFNSEPVKQLRRDILSDTPTDVCSRCYHEELVGGTSRRIRSNQKSVIFTKTAFHPSFEQSPGRRYFTDDGVTDTLPIDLHIDLGNYCNLACKMCWSGASSRIATQYVRWGYEDHRQYLGNDWTQDKDVWSKLLDELVTIPNLKNIHFMGGETLLTKKLEEFVDVMIAHKKFDLCFSFVTNGTVFNDSLMEKLKQFARVGIEVSIETTTKHNDYIRQGTDTDLVLANIKKYQEFCNGTTITITIRPAISALSVGYYHTLLDYCINNKFMIKSLLVTNPAYLNVNVLPMTVKLEYKEKYQILLEKLSSIDCQSMLNESDPNNYLKSIKIQIEQVLSMLQQPSNEDLLGELVRTCKRWDEELGFNAINLYPELTDVFKAHDY